MSHHDSPSKRRRAVALLPVVLAFCLGLEARGGPRMETIPERMDYGTVKQGEKKRKIFRIRNAGDADLVIEQIRPSCAECMVDRVKVKRLEPGREIELPVTYHAAAVPGKHQAYVTLHTNDPTDPLKRIYLVVNISAQAAKPRLEVDLERIDLGIVISGKPIAQSVVLRNTGTATLQLRKCTTSPGIALGTKLPQALGAGKHIAAKVLCTWSRKGVMRGHISIVTDDPTRSVLTIPVSGYVADREDIVPLLRGIQLSLERDDDGTHSGGRVRIENHDDFRISVSREADSEKGPLQIEPGGSLVLEAPQPAGGTEDTFWIRIGLPAPGSAPSSSERR